MSRHSSENSDIKLDYVADKMQLLDESGLTDESPSRWKRWLSICVLYFAMVDSLSTYSIVMSSLFPYLLQLTNGQGSTFLLGAVVAGYCFGQLVAAPILGFWSDRRSAKEPLIVCFSVSIAANIAYCYASALPSGGEYVVIVARIAMGGCAGISAIVRSYIAHSTTEKERSLGLAGVSGSQTMGLFVGPLLALLFVPLGDKGISIPGIRFHFNMYTGPVYLSALLDVFCIVLIAVAFKEHKIKSDKKKEDIPCEKLKKKGVDWLAVMVTLFIVFVMYSTVPVIESIMVPYSMDEFAWNREQAVLYNNIIFGFLAVLAIVSFIVIGVIVKWVELRIMMMIGLVILGCSFVIFIPMSNQIPEITGINEANSTVAVAAVGCRNRHLNWCIELPQLLLPQYIIGLIVLTAGYSMSVLPTFTLYSRLLGPFPQGMLMGVLSSVNSLAQAIAPLFVTYMYDHTGPQITFGTMVGIISLGIIILMLFCYRMVPYGQKRHL